MSIIGGICTDFPGWMDSNGLGCDWYETYDDPGCPRFGDLSESSWNGETFDHTSLANDNCCYCAGTAVSDKRVKISFNIKGVSL